MPGNIYNIPASLPFSDTLAQWVLEKYGASPTELSRVLILLPSRRACVALRDAFLRVSDGKPLLLPRMQPIGDVDKNILLAAFTHQADIVPPDNFEMKRIFILARLIQQQDSSRIDHAVKLAAELAKLLDELEREQVPIHNLMDIVPAEYAEHWQITVNFLKILSEHWPQIAKEEGIVSPVTHRNRMLEMLAQHWKTNPPTHPVIVAGTTGSIPATASLIATIARMPQGMIVLPSLDTQAGKEYFEYLNEAHSQWGMRRLLGKLDCDVTDVKDIIPSDNSQRLKLLSEIMRPAELSEIWQKLELDISRATSGMKRVTCGSIQEEAAAAALIMRQTLETPGKTAALITHDRRLARQVSAIMRRFGVNVDDAAGIPLMQTPIASYLRLVAGVVAEDFDSVTLLSLLKHPLTHAGMERLRCVEAAREYERVVLRSSRAVMHNPLNTAAYASRLSADAVTLLNNLENTFTLLFREFRHGTLHAIIKAHIKCAGELAGTNLWEGPEAEAITDFLHELQSSSVSYDMEITATTYLEVFDALLSTKVFRQEYGQHPRLKILSPIEARMQSFDRIILGSMNEGCWPQTPPADPWLNRPMRAQVGLPTPERSIGLSAHDFFVLANTPEIFITRSEKIDGTPTTASRWLVKLDALLAKFSAASMIEDSSWRYLAMKINDSEKAVPIDVPMPRPPLHARPKSLSVTQVETLMRNPYVTYISQILELYPLKPLSRELDNTDFGSAVHRAIEKFVKQYPASLPEKPYEKLLQYGQAALQPFMRNERVKALWWPRFMRIAAFVIHCEEVRRDSLKQVLAEMNGSRILEDFTVTGRADRIEEHKDGSITIIDYKTGNPPSEKNVRRGLSSQMPLLGYIMEDSLKRKVHSLEFWHVHGDEKGGEIKAVDISYIKSAEEGLRKVIRQYQSPDFPYLWRELPDFTGQYEDYLHIARVKEWG